MLGRNPVGDVNHLDVGSDPLDDAAADAREVVLEPEVGQEGDEPACDAASLTARASPSRSWLSASATTSSPSLRASAVVTGPIETHAISASSAASARAADAEATTARSPAGKESGRSSIVR